MKNIAVVFAGGRGERMHSADRPKQFLEINGKPIIIYTIELFDNHPAIDGIVVVCIESWIPFLEENLKKFEIAKVGKVVAGGASGQESIYNGLLAAKDVYGEQCNVLIHDGVRPLISPQTITDNIEALKANESCITCVPATETLIVNNMANNTVGNAGKNVKNYKDGDGDGQSCLEIPSRQNSVIARAPQSFRLRNILAAHERANLEGRKDFIDSCSMMHHYGYPIHIISGPVENIKITTPIDFYIFKAILEMRENHQTGNA